MISTPAARKVRASDDMMSQKSAQRYRNGNPSTARIGRHKHGHGKNWFWQILIHSAWAWTTYVIGSSSRSFAETSKVQVQVKYICCSEFQVVAGLVIMQMQFKYGRTGRRISWIRDCFGRLGLWVRTVRRLRRFFVSVRSVRRMCHRDNLSCFCHQALSN